MSVPTTPTAVRLGHEHWCVPPRGCTCRVLAFAVIEAEAAKQERERLRALVIGHHDSKPCTHWGTAWSCVECSVILALLADPEEKP